MVMGAFVLSRALGLIRVALLSSVFGAGNDLDAFNAASRVTDTLYILIAGGALGSAFIPVFTSHLARGERDTAWQVASAIVNLVLIVTVVAGIATAILAPWLVSTILAPGYEPPVQQATVRLLRWMLASTVIFGTSGLLMGILNANDHFLLPALAPSMYNLGIIGGVLVGVPRWGIYGAAAGTVIGALLHLLIQLPALRNLDWRYLPTLGLHLPSVREVGRLMAPRVLGMAITQLNFWVNTNLGSRIGVEGVVTALNLGWILMLLPQGIFAQAIATVLLPSFSAQAAREERDRLRATLLSALLVVFYLTMPAAVGLILLREPLVEVLFMRGAFDPTDVAMAAWALAWYAVGLVAHSELEIVTRAFYAMHDTATPVWVGGGAMAINVGLSLLFSQVFAWIGTRWFALGYQPWVPLGGLALANSLATILETWTLSAILGRRLGKWKNRELLASLWRTLASSAAMGIALWNLARWMPTHNAWLVGGSGIVVGTGVFFLASLLLRSPELEFVWSAVRRRWTR
jgi:putative peptidoglycan lipid II flippase